MLRTLSINDFKFHPNVYTDINILQKMEYTISVGGLNNGLCKKNKEADIFIRVYDGINWHYMTQSFNAEQDGNVLLNKIYSQINFDSIIRKNVLLLESKIEINKYNSIIPIDEISSNDAKETLLNFYNKSLCSGFVSKGKYMHLYDYTFYCSSLGTEIQYSRNRFEIAIMLQNQTKSFLEVYYNYTESFFDLVNDYKNYLSWINKVCYFVEASNIENGNYNLILANKPAGLFVHECIGHLSEADLIQNNPCIKELFSTKAQVGIPSLSIIDDGSLNLSGWVPYDNEGIKSKKTFLVKNGLLNSMLHSIETSISYKSLPTGNSRSIDGKHKPIVRMTNTYLDNGTKKLEALIKDTSNGIYIDSFSTCYGYNKVVLTPNRSYYITNGAIGDPVILPNITDNALSLLGTIDSICDDLKFSNSLMTGCGKADQSFINVSFGSPHIRLSNIYLNW